jgi:hypothetical protein
VTNRFIETAIEVALMPAEAYAKEKSAAGRVATLDAFRCYHPKPHRIFLPAAYEKTLRRIYGRLDDARELDSSTETIPPGTQSRADLTLFDFAKVARIAFHAIGTDFGHRLSKLEEQGREGKAVVFQVWVNLTAPHCGAAVEILRERGYFLGGAFPRWFDGDGFLMQKLFCPPDFAGIVLVSDFAKELLEIIRADWERVESAKR